VLLVVTAGGGSSKVMVCPSVVMTALPPLAPKEIVLDPIWTPPGPMTKVSLFTVTVDGCEPMSKVLPPMTTSLGLEGGGVVVTIGGRSFRVMVCPSVVMTALPPLAPKEMVLEPI
jgi:hypothetical protein